MTLAAVAAVAAVLVWIAQLLDGCCWAAPAHCRNNRKCQGETNRNGWGVGVGVPD